MRGGWGRRGRSAPAYQTEERTSAVLLLLSRMYQVNHSFILPHCLPWARVETLKENWKSITGLEVRAEMDGIVGRGLDEVLKTERDAERRRR